MHGALFLLPPLTDRSSSTIVVPCATALVRLHAAAGPRGSPGGDAGHEAEAAADTRGVSSELRRPLRCSGRRPHSPPAAPGREGTAAGRFALKARSGADGALRYGAIKRPAPRDRRGAGCARVRRVHAAPACYVQDMPDLMLFSTPGRAPLPRDPGRRESRFRWGAGRFTMSLPDAYWTGDQWALAPSGPVDGPFYGLLVPRRPQGNRRPATMPTTPLATPRRRPRCRHSSLSEGKVGKRGVFPSGTPLPGARRAPGAAPEALPGGPAPIQEVRADL
ncbi:unnamed protein product [Prorocentrum cordatum]|uniref:Uncharacterized protein n=1 Tax=Prorocentrum cordatum TaxID=2364126 RepID=A0ABN9QCM9_9DINO|nr:unnamed protein product [Polarella glacialis]